MILISEVKADFVAYGLYYLLATFSITSSSPGLMQGFKSYWVDSISLYFLATPFLLFIVVSQWHSMLCFTMHASSILTTCQQQRTNPLTSTPTTSTHCVINSCSTIMCAVVTLVAKCACVSLTLTPRACDVSIYASRRQKDYHQCKLQNVRTACMDKCWSKYILLATCSRPQQLLVLMVLLHVHI